MTDPTQHQRLDDARRAARLSMAECWVSYFALGGYQDLAGIDGFLTGRQDLPAREIDILATAIGDHRRSGDSAALSPDDIPLLRDLSGLGPLPQNDPDALSHSRDVPYRTGVDISGQARDSGGATSPVDLSKGSVMHVLAGRQTSVVAIAAPQSPSRPPTQEGAIARIDASSNLGWETHDGDELLVLLTGGLRIVLDQSQSSTTVLDQPHQAYVVPGGRWHRHDAIHAGTTVLYLTPVPQSAA